MSEQVICKDGRIIRLAPFNAFPDMVAAQDSPVIFVKSDGYGFYQKHPDGFAAYDVTALWDIRQSCKVGDSTVGMDDLRRQS